MKLSIVSCGYHGCGEWKVTVTAFMFEEASKIERRCGEAWTTSEYLKKKSRSHFFFFSSTTNSKRLCLEPYYAFMRSHIAGL
jgi:hypothetical protein